MDICSDEVEVATIGRTDCQVDVTKEYAADLACGLSVYAGWDRYNLVWHWEVTGEDIEENGKAETFSKARQLGARAARNLINQSIEELKRA